MVADLLNRMMPSGGCRAWLAGERFAGVFTGKIAAPLCGALQTVSHHRLQSEPCGTAHFA
jgi:hypothetical protein